MEPHKTTVANLLHVLTQDLEVTPVPVTKDIQEMEKPVKVRKYFLTFVRPLDGLCGQLDLLYVNSCNRIETLANTLS